MFREVRMKRAYDKGKWIADDKMERMKKVDVRQ
jgi:hypothetical protein